jgi:Domain of unknown function (DUF4159)
MTRNRLLLGGLPIALGIAILSGAALAQRFRGREMYSEDDRRGVPDWKVDERFKNDVFTFVRVEYDSYGGRGGGFGGGYGGWGGGWSTDFPDSDLNFSFRLQQLTALKVKPQPLHMRLTDERLFDHPFLYLIEPGGLSFSEEEVLALRKYLYNGGFLMVDDFWGDRAWENFYHEIKRVFPEREPQELPLEHEIFRCVYRLKERPQVPSIHSWQRTGLSYEFHGPGCENVHYRGIFDDKGRMMVVICHNTDLGDGWEREGQDEAYFHEFCENRSYPMGINIITYAMTH